MQQKERTASRAGTENRKQTDASDSLENYQTDAYNNRPGRRYHHRFKNLNSSVKYGGLVLQDSFI